MKLASAESMGSGKSEVVAAIVAEACRMNQVDGRVAGFVMKLLGSSYRTGGRDIF